MAWFILKYCVSCHCLAATSPEDAVFCLQKIYVGTKPSSPKTVERFWSPICRNQTLIITCLSVHTTSTQIIHAHLRYSARTPSSSSTVVPPADRVQYSSSTNPCSITHSPLQRCRQRRGAVIGNKIISKSGSKRYAK